jgi:hypothetical protein
VHLAFKTKNLLDRQPAGLRFEVPASGPDLVLRVTAHAGTAPVLWQLGPSYAWLNQAAFPYEFYLSDVQGHHVTVEFKAEDAAAVKIQSVEAYAHPDVCYREFEHGMVLANPSPRPYTFDLATLFPGKHFRRLQASAHQDAKTNDGSEASGKVTLPPHDGLFLTASSK